MHKVPYPAAVRCLLCDDVTMKDSTGFRNYTDSTEISSFAFLLPLPHFRHLLRLPHVKLQLYNTLIRPTVAYASETWVLKENMTNKLMICERKIMREIFGPRGTDDGYWRIKTNQEINDILKA